MMKKLTICLAFVLLFTGLFAGCDRSSPGGGGGIERPTVPETGINIVENGGSRYTIIVPEDADANLMFAANDLQMFLQESSGTELPIITEDGQTFDASAYVISLGQTNVFAASGLELSSDLASTGYLLVRKGNTLLINAKDSNGIISGVYDMLNYTIGLEIYSYDEFDYEVKETVPLLDFNIEFSPSIDVRDIMMRSLTSQYRQRMRLYNGLGLGQWITFAHTTITALLPYSQYGAEHPEWYSDDASQVCYSNEEMRMEMEEQIKLKIASNPDGKYVMIGHEDNLEMCDRKDCKCAEERALYGGYGGQELHFTNTVAEELAPWLAENYPDREIVFVFFAYITSQAPPVKTENINGTEVPVKDENGSYIPYYDGFTIRDNVMVLYCPIDSDWHKGFSETENVPQYTQLKGWADLFAREGLSDNIIVWSYSLAVYNYMIPMNNFGMHKQHYQFYQEANVHYVMDQAYSSSGVPCFEALQIYTQSKLMYDNSLDYNELAYDFIEHYYGPAAPAFKRYFNFFRTYYAYLTETSGITGSIWQNMEQAAFWPTEVVDTMMQYLDEGLEAIQPLRETDPERFSLLNDRLRRERLTPIYIMFLFHINEIPQGKRTEYFNDMVTYTQMYNIVETAESQVNMGTMIETWRNQLFGTEV